MNNESKDNDAAREQLRFTSIHSINRKMKKRENVLKVALETIETVSKESDVLKHAFEYDFDIFEFVDYTNRPLLVLGIYLLSNAFIFKKLFSKNKVNLLECAYYLDLCEKLYRNTNPYHNSIHATDVMQFTMILLQSSYMQSNFEDYESLAAFMSAVAHDCGHIGKNNDFLIKSRHNLALKFNNESCLEKYHIEQFHQVISDNSKGNWIKHFGQKTQKYIIDIVEYAIIGTDMGVYHSAIKQKLKEKYSLEFVQNNTLKFEDKQFIIRAIIHLSDISNPMRPFSVAKKWADRVNEEFFNQGDVMKKMGLEISTGCDRNKTDIIKNQYGFVNFCIKPLLQSLQIMIGELDWCSKNIDINELKWNQLKNINV